MLEIAVQPITENDFSPFGDLIDFNREFDFQINNGMCDRYHALAETEALGNGAKTIISLGRAKARTLPLILDMLERHPMGSQAFFPLQQKPFLVVVAEDENGKPALPRAFITDGFQGVNYHRNTWHAILTPLGEPCDFLIVDRAGAESNLEEHFFDSPITITNGQNQR